ncbi:flavodoxin domain-containing protein [Amycolatopsis sp. CA-161197]|uniref:flavodoxin domain-containing protein n=1 Tax=Amycolatopsis sp. CA-161197 TaxID=3239922 RepID=UPI003D931070
MRVLLAVATRHGATREIAEQVALAMTSALNDADVRADVDVLDVAHVTAVAGYDAVVLGSAVYIGHWLEAARHLAREHRDKWRRVPV